MSDKPLNIIYNLFHNFFLSRGRVVTNHNDYRLPVFKVIRQIKKETGMLLEYSEAYILWMAALSVRKIKGDMAEVGVYTGGSARLICETGVNNNLFLFDTFEGLPEVDDETGTFYKGDFKSSYQKVKKDLKKFKNVHIYQGLFPASSKPVKNRTFSLVHLDADIYKSTLDSLIFFYPRMARGGILVIHDYVLVDGVRKACDEFFLDKKEPILTMTGNQCLVMKL